MPACLNRCQLTSQRLLSLAPVLIQQPQPELLSSTEALQHAVHAGCCAKACTCSHVLQPQGWCPATQRALQHTSIVGPLAWHTAHTLQQRSPKTEALTVCITAC